MEVRSFRWQDHALAYEVHGTGPRTFVFIHGLLLPAACNRALAARIAVRGHRVVIPELLGHGRSDGPLHATEHRLEYLAAQTLALLDHLEVDEAVVGGVSLGANVALQLAVDEPSRLRGIVAEMPVLERGGVAAVAVFAPMLVAMRVLPGPARLLTRAAARLPRTGWDVADAFLEAASMEPRRTAAVLHGLLSGPLAPSGVARRAIEVPTLVIGHGRDLLHPLDDAAALAAELPDSRFLEARSLWEARTRPGRVADAIADFLDDVWRPRDASRQVGA